MANCDKINCPHCESASCLVDYNLEWKDCRFGSYQIASCQNCGLSFVNPFPEEETLDRLYDSMQYHEEDRKAGNLWEMTSEQIAQKVSHEGGFIREYQKWLPVSGKVLEVGSGWGTLLKCFQQKGYEVKGIEVSETTSRFARERLGLEIANIPAERMRDVSDTDFDIVVMRHTLEHFRDPCRILAHVKRMLRPGGLLIIKVPDYGSFDRVVYGKDWPAFAPYHLWYFSRRGLTKLLEECGFAAVAFRRFMSELIFPRSRSSVLHRIGRSALNRIGGHRLFSGRSIGVAARNA